MKSKTHHHRAIRTLGRTFFRFTGIKSYVWSNGFWWYRWHPDAGIGFAEDWEKPLEKYLLKPGECFVDIGAHVGHWTVRASPFYQKVFAFEPDAFTNRVLRRNITRNGLRNVVVFGTGLSDRRGRVTLFQYGPKACNSLRKSHISGQPVRATNGVDIRPLDDYQQYFRNPLVIKIDVEGEELKVLMGAAATIEKFRPLLIVEVHFADEVSLVLEELKKHGYGVTNPKGLGSNAQSPTYLVANPSES